MNNPSLFDVLPPEINFEKISFASKVRILAVAVADIDFLDDMASNNRRTVLKAYDRRSGMLIDAAVVVLLNQVRKMALENGSYNEWPALREAIMRPGDQPRALFASLRAFLASADLMDGRIRVRIRTFETLDRSRLQTILATVETEGRRVEFREYWPKGDKSSDFPSIGAIEEK